MVTCVGLAVRTPTRGSDGDLGPFRGTCERRTLREQISRRRAMNQHEVLSDLREPTSSLRHAIPEAAAFREFAAECSVEAGVPS
jgi:hypothetical protein